MRATHTHTHTLPRARTQTNMYIPKHAYAHTTNTCIHTLFQKDTHEHTHTYIHTHIHSNAYILMNAPIHSHTHR